jgi:hypothetical protein
MMFGHEQTVPGATAYLEQEVIIKNLSDRKLSVKWGGEPFTLAPHAEEKVPMWLAKHIRKHTIIDGEEMTVVIEQGKLKCDTCFSEFDTKRELNAHEIIHQAAPEVSKKKK